MKNYKYKAFISYRHLPLDKEVATSLQNYLEKFKQSKKEDSWRIFRDESELPTSSNLSEDIHNALCDSEFLIVICSKALKESKWCLEEINTFKNLHNGTTDKILTILIEGTPSESFPKELCVSNRIRETEKGSICEEVEVEPLAANIVADSKSEREKRKKTEFIRIAAPLLGVSYDELYNRRKRDEIRRKTTIFGVIAASISVFSIAFGMYSYTMQTKLNEQLKLTQQANEKVQEQLEISQLENAKNYVTQSEFYAKENKWRDSIECAIKSFEIKEDKEPLLTKSVELLANQLGVFETKNKLPIKRFAHKDFVDNIWFLMNGKRLLVRDVQGYLYLWNVGNGELIWESDFSVETDDVVLENQTDLQHFGGISKKYNGITTGGTSYSSGAVSADYKKTAPKEDLFKEVDSFLIINDQRLLKINANNGNQKVVAESKRTYGGFERVQNNVILFETDCLFIFDENGDIKNKFSISETLTDDIWPEYDLKILYIDDEFLAVTSSWLHSDEPVHIYKIKNDLIKKECSIELDKNDDNAIGDYNIYPIGVAGDFIIESYSYGIMSQCSSKLYYIDGKNKNIKWKTEIDTTDSIMKDAGFFDKKNIDEDESIIFFVSSNRIDLFAAENGTKLGDFSFEHGILDYYTVRTGAFFVTLSNGDVFAVPIETVIGDMVAFLLDSDMCDLAAYDYVCGIDAVAYKNSPYVDFYEEINNEGCKVIYEYDGTNKANSTNIKEIYTPSEEDVYVVNDYHSIFTVNYKTGKKTILNTISETEYYSDIFLCGRRIYIQEDYHDNFYKVYDIDTSQYIGDWQLEDRISNLCVIEASRKIAYLDKYSHKNNAQEVVITDTVTEKRIDMAPYIGEWGNVEKIIAEENGKKLIVLCEYRKSYEEEKRNKIIEIEEDLSVKELEYQFHNELNNVFLETEVYVNTSGNIICVLENENDSKAYLYDIESEDVIIIDLPGRELIKAFWTEGKIYLLDNRYTVHIFDYFGKKLDDIKLSDTETGTLNKINIVMESFDDTLMIKTSKYTWFIDTEKSEVNYVYNGFGKEVLGYNNANQKVVIKEYDKLVECPLYSAKDIYDMAKKVILPTSSPDLKVPSMDYSEYGYLANNYLIVDRPGNETTIEEKEQIAKLFENVLNQSSKNVTKYPEEVSTIIADGIDGMVDFGTTSNDEYSVYGLASADKGAYGILFLNSGVADSKGTILMDHWIDRFPPKDQILKKVNENTVLFSLTDDWGTGCFIEKIFMLVNVDGFLVPQEYSIQEYKQAAESISRIELSDSNNVVYVSFENDLLHDLELKFDNEDKLTLLQPQWNYDLVRFGNDELADSFHMFISVIVPTEERVVPIYAGYIDFTVKINNLEGTPNWEIIDAIPRYNE